MDDAQVPQGVAPGVAPGGAPSVPGDAAAVGQQYRDQCRFHFVSC